MTPAGAPAHRFALVRILGNDLPPMHSETQTLDNLAFVLEHEPALEDCRKVFVLNRIADPARERALGTMVREAGLETVRLPFEPQVYRRCSTFGQKVEYATNANPARNAALDEGLSHALLSLPFDGQLFFTAHAWQALRRDVDRSPDAGVFVVPMFRLGDNAALRDAPQAPPSGAVESEPQLAFHRDARERFDTALSYGLGPKVDLLLRLGVPGPWDRWPGERFVRLRARAAARRSPRFGRARRAGYVYRLAPGNPRTVGDIAFRNAARREGVHRLVAELDRRFARG